MAISAASKGYVLSTFLKSYYPTLTCVPKQEKTQSNPTYLSLA